MIFNENQFVIENDKQLVGFQGGVINWAGPMNFTLSNNYVNMYSFGSEFKPTLAIGFLNEFCNLEDNITQTATIVSNTLERDNLPTFDISAFALLL